MWLAAIIGSIAGLGFSILGYLLDCGPGGSMEGPFWRILLVGVPSLIVASYVGEILVRKLTPKMLARQASVFKNSMMAFVLFLFGGLIAFIVGMEIMYLLGKITGAIEGLNWTEALLYPPLMAGLYGFIPCLIGGVICSLFVFIYLMRDKKRS